MGQSDIIDFLEQVGKAMSRTEIAEALEDNARKISKILAELIEHNEIKFIELDKDTARKYYKSPRRMRLYYSAEIKINKKDLQDLFKQSE